MAMAKTIRCKWEGAEVTLGMDEAGSGRSIVLLPALSSISTRAEMRPLFDRLAPEFRVSTVDWPRARRSLTAVGGSVAGNPLRVAVQGGYEGMAYITPRLKLEFGARGDPWPTEEKTIRPYAADDFPGFFEEPDCAVTVLSARRTFWEEATALHAEAHRPKNSPTPQYFSRHYYDIAMLLDTEDGKAAADFALLAQVAKHKAAFFRSGWASYDTARPGMLQLMPSEARQKDLRADYRDMAPMMFDDKPLSFNEILARIQKLQNTINASTSAPQ
jgi:hypothetical protein